MSEQLCYEVVLTFLHHFTLREKCLNTIPYIPVYGLHVPIYGGNLSEYGKIRERIQAFFTQCMFI